MEVGQLLSRGPDEHIAHEQSMIGSSADDAHSDTISLIPSSISIDNIDTISCVQVVNSSFPVNPPDLNHISEKGLIHVMQG